MNVLEMIGYGCCVGALFKAHHTTRAFEQSSGLPSARTRDILVILKNRLFLRGVVLFVFSIALRALSEKWEAYRLFALIPLIFSGAVLCFTWPRKMEEELLRRNSAELPLNPLKQIFFWYTLALTGLVMGATASVLA